MNLKRHFELTVSILAVVFVLLNGATDCCGDERPELGGTIVLPAMAGLDGVPALEAAAERKCTVLVFLGTECPLAKLYAGRIARFSDEYAARGVAVIGVGSNIQDDAQELGEYAKEHGLTFPVVRDTDCVLADLLGATRTPEAFVLDSAGALRYRGRIDAQFTFGAGVGLAQPSPKREDLRIAVDQLLAGEEVAVAETEVRGCLIGRPKQADATADVTYANQISRLFQKRCLECHREGQIGPFAIESYEEAVGWADMILEVVQDGRMPPWHANPAHGSFANDSRLTDEEKGWIAAWVDAGCPEGDRNELPTPVNFPERWFMGEEPDEVIWMSDEPVDVKPEGIEDYRYYIVDPGFKEDRWVRMAECLPGNASVVHHIIVYIQSPDAKSSNIGHNELLVGFAPGTRPYVPPKGWARKIPAGSKLIFEMHYTPIGTPQQDRSRLGLVCVDEADVTHQTWTTNAINTRFAIPPNAANHEVKAQKVFDEDVQLLSLFPHMHMRGKAFRYELEYPDGTQEILLDIPRYDFNWQSSFVLSKPKDIPRGTRMKCTAYYDNSTANLSNPDPTQTVRWGEQTWEEMLIGWHDVAIARVPSNGSEGDATETAQP